MTISAGEAVDLLGCQVFSWVMRRRMREALCKLRARAYRSYARQALRREQQIARVCCKHNLRDLADALSRWRTAPGLVDREVARLAAAAQWRSAVIELSLDRRRLRSLLAGWQQWSASLAALDECAHARAFIDRKRLADAVALWEWRAARRRQIVDRLASLDERRSYRTK